jgi:transcriptional regulator with XRE-family HTH domain
MGEPNNDNGDLALKIRRLVEERGWNQEEFARKARLNRHTVRTILLDGPKRRLRNATILQCAYALGLSVSELRDQTLERLLPRMNAGAAAGEDSLRRRYEQVTQPELKAWIERNPDRARQLSDDELAELIALQNAGSAFGVEGIVARIERRRKLLRMVHKVAGTEYLDLLEQFVAVLHDKVQPSSGPP